MAPGILIVDLRHWYVNGAAPVAVTVKDAGEPAHTVCDVGLPVIAAEVHVEPLYTTSAKSCGGC